MKKENQPQLHEVEAVCTGCNSRFQTLSTQSQIRVALCSHCHPVFTGKQKFVDTAGRIERFQKKYNKK